MKKQFLACMLTLLLSALTACPALAADMSGSGWSYTGTVLTITGNISDYGLASSRSDWFIGTPFERNGIDHTVTEMIVEEGVTSLGDLTGAGLGFLGKQLVGAVPAVDDLAYQNHLCFLGVAGAQFVCIHNLTLVLDNLNSHVFPPH